MKKLISMAIFLVGAVAFSCKEEVNLGALDSFPPTVMSTKPDGTTKIGVAFDVKVFLVDGPSSPLASATVTLEDSLGNEIFSTEKTLTGVKDSVILTSDDIGSTDLGLDQYNIIVHAVDKAGNTTDKTFSFRVSENDYSSKNKKMFLAGEFNGWGALEMTLVAPYTWKATNVDFKKGKFKFKNTPDWTDQDWGDSDCNGTMEISTNGGPDTNCAYNGVTNVTFNDETLKYTVAPAVTFEHKLNNLYLLGTFNNFNGVNSGFSLVANNEWQLDEARLKSGDEFRFATTAFGGRTFGPSGTDGVAKEDAGDIVATGEDAFYKITFNDKTLVWTKTLVRYPYPDAMFLVGGGTSGGWDANNAQPFMKTANGVFEIYAHITAGGEFKYLPQKGSFNGDWGPVNDDVDQPKGTGALTQDGEENANVTDDGFYRIILNFVTKTYSVQKTNWGIIGDATGSWDNDQDMVYDGGTTWSKDITLGTGFYKFRANDGWDINYGMDTAGTLKAGGDNIASPGAGSYHVTMNLASTGYVYTITPN